MLLLIGTSLVVGDPATARIISTIVVISTVLGFVQQARSETGVAPLQARLTLHAGVVRDGQRGELPIDQWCGVTSWYR